MLYFVKTDDEGRILQHGAAPESAWPAIVATLGAQGLHQVPPPQCDLAAAYWDAGRVVPMPARPSSHHEFDYAKKRWEVNADGAWAQVRAERDALLAATDWLVLRAQETGQPVPAAWLAYRQALRDVTGQADPRNIVWPQRPQ